MSRMKQLLEGCNCGDMDSKVLLAGLSVKPPKPGPLAFKMFGETPELVGVAPVKGGGIAAAGFVVGLVGVENDGVGGGINVAGGPVGNEVGGVIVAAGDGIAGGDDDDEDDVGKMHEPVLGFELVMAAAPPKSQLVVAGFFW